VCTRGPGLDECPDCHRTGFQPPAAAFGRWALRCEARPADPACGLPPLSRGVSSYAVLENFFAYGEVAALRHTPGAGLNVLALFTHLYWLHSVGQKEELRAICGALDHILEDPLAARVLSPDPHTGEPWHLRHIHIRVDGQRKLVLVYCVDPQAPEIVEVLWLGECDQAPATPSATQRVSSCMASDTGSAASTLAPPSGPQTDRYFAGSLVDVESNPSPQKGPPVAQEEWAAYIKAANLVNLCRIRALMARHLPDCSAPTDPCGPGASNCHTDASLRASVVTGDTRDSSPAMGSFCSAGADSGRSPTSVALSPEGLQAVEVMTGVPASHAVIFRRRPGP